MTQLGFYFDQTRCTGCCTCIVACKDWHDVEAGPASWRRVITIERGKYPDPFVAFLSTSCYHCGNPACVNACPSGAISKRVEDGVVIVDRETCSGCKTIPETLTDEKTKHSPCIANCPAHINIQGFVGLAAEGKYIEALRLFKEENPFPAICGRLCNQPCEKACNRGEIDAAVSIRALHRFLADLDLAGTARYVPDIRGRKTGKVAIIGSGPAGLTCAYYLARNGYQVTVFEKAAAAGGMLTSCIPVYRLPRDVAEAEIQVIRDLGVTVKNGVEIGKDLTIEQLRKEGFQAFFLAVGAGVSNRLGIEGEDAKGVYPALSFLAAINQGESVSLGRRVVVIGGGNVAVDAARVARRLGAKEVEMVCLESAEEMPASDQELSEAGEEGIRIVNHRGPRRVLVQGGKVTGLELKEVERVFDQYGRFNPTYFEDQVMTVPTDAVIIAAGQKTDWACLGDECSFLEFDPLTLQSDTPDIFSGGDAVTGPKTVIEAVAAGKEAALSINRYLAGTDLKEGREKDWSVTAKAQKEKYSPVQRARIPRITPETRVSNFEEVQEGINASIVSEEANRCLSCGYACLQSCPYSAPQFGPGENEKMQKCDFCLDRLTEGKKTICVGACPMRALDIGPMEELRAKYGDAKEAQGFINSEERDPSVIFKPKKDTRIIRRLEVMPGSRSLLPGKSN